MFNPSDEVSVYQRVYNGRHDPERPQGTGSGVQWGRLGPVDGIWTPQV